MSTDRDVQAHEEALVEFVDPYFRRRFRASLAEPRLRRKLTRRFGHFDDLDGRYATRLKPRASASEVELLLRQKGAPRMCYVVSEHTELDGQWLTLSEALGLIVASGIGTFLSCQPGHLGFFEDEDAQYVLEKT